MPEFDLIAVLEGRHATPPQPEVQMVVQNDLTAVLSATPRPASRAPQSLSRHLQTAAAHLAWQTACMRLAPLLPVRLDSPLTHAGAAACLTANQPFLTHLLSRYAGMAQMQIAVRWPEAATAPLAKDADLTFRHDTWPVTGDAQHQNSLRLSMMVGTELASVSASILPLPLSAGLILHGTVLLPLRRLPDLTRALARIEAIWPEGLQIRQTGPEPITAFATLDLTPVSAKQVDHALHSFGLHAHADLAHLAAARRRRLVTIGRLDDARREELAEQAEILAAAARLPDHKQGFALCRIWTDGQNNPHPARQAVA